MFIEQLCSC